MRSVREIQVVRVLVAAALFCLAGSVMAAQYGGGSGTAEDPYQIWTAEQMNAIGAEPNDWDKHFKLMADIDLSAYDGKEGRPQFRIIGHSRQWPDHKPFVGFFDGNGHTISNLKYRSDGQDYVGLFGYVGTFTGSGRTEIGIKNLGLVNPTVGAGRGKYVGSLIGQFRDAVISGCYVEGGSVSGGQFVGGLIGASIETAILSYTPWLLIENCHASAIVSGTDSVGGLIGYYSSSHIFLKLGGISACYAGGCISGKEKVGGLAGHVRVGPVLNCYARSQVEGDRFVGGLIGISHATVQASYSTGRVTGKQDLGGFIGSATAATWQGLDEEGDTAASFWDTQTSGQASSAGGTGKIKAKMQTAKTFLDAGWDFAGETANGTEDIWWIDEGRDYPRLWWEIDEREDGTAASDN